MLLTLNNSWIFVRRSLLTVSNLCFASFFFLSEGATVSSCDDTITTVESDTFKYFRTQFNTVTNNKITVEVRDIQGEI